MLEKIAYSSRNCNQTDLYIMPYTTIGDIDLYYEVHGTEDPGLVFAHGGGGNATSWWQQE